MSGQVDRQRGPVRGECRQVLAVGHRGGQVGNPGQDHRLSYFGDGQFPAQCGRGGSESRNARDDLVADTQRIEATTLFSDRAVEPRIAGMQPSDIVARGVGAGDLVNDLIQCQRAGVDDAGISRAFRKQVVGHDRARVQTNSAPLEQSLAADGDQVGSSGSSTDEVHRHSSVTDHWVIGICGRQPVNPPIGSEL